MKNLNKITLAIGIILTCYSLTLESFKDYDDFQKKILEIGESYSENKNEEYDQLRNNHLTIKYKLFDYGITLIIISLFIRFISLSKKLNINKSKKILLAILSFLSLISSFYLHLFIYVARDGAPYWADSIGIPMYYIGEITIYLSFYFAFNLFGVFYKSREKELLKDYILNNKIFSFWYGLQIIMISTFLIITIYHSVFLIVLSLFICLTFYLSMFKKNEIQ